MSKRPVDFRNAKIWKTDLGITVLMILVPFAWLLVSAPFIYLLKWLVDLVIGPHKFVIETVVGMGISAYIVDRVDCYLHAR